MVSLNLGGPMLVFTVIGGSIFLIGLIGYGYYKYKIEIVKAGGGAAGGGDESAPATDEIATEGGEVADEFAEAGLEDQHLANQAQIENYESAILNEEQKKFQVMKGIRNRIPLMRTQGVNAPDPQYGNKGATLRVVTAGFLKNIINICAVELTQEQKILQFEALNRRKTHIAATRERHEIQLEKHEIKDENILHKEILRDLRKAPKKLKPLYEQVKKTQLNIEKFEKARLNFKNRERNMEVAEEKMEKLEEKFAKGFENTLKNTEKEAVKFRNFLLSNANITPQQVTNEYRQLDKVMIAASTANVNFLKEQYELLKTEHKKLEFRLVVLKETEEIQRLIAYRDQLLARISQVKGGKTQKLFTQKDLRARDRARNLSQKTLQLFAHCEKEIAKLNSEITTAQKELQAAQRELNEFKSISI